MGIPQFVLALVFNLVPALSAWLFGWSSFDLILLYWTENVVIGAVNFVKVVIVGATQKQYGLTAALAPFFLFHYSVFLLIHAVIIWTVFGQRSADFVLTDVPGLLWMAIRTDPFLFWNAVSLAAFQVANFLLYWVAASGWRGVDVQAQTFAPYGRVAVVHLTILLAAVPVTVIGEPLIAVVCLALLKTALEVGLTWRKAPLPSPSERLT